MQVCCESKVIRHGKGRAYFTFTENPIDYNKTVINKTVTAHYTWKEGNKQHLQFSYTLTMEVAGLQKQHPMNHAPGTHTLVWFASTKSLGCSGDLFLSNRTLQMGYWANSGQES